MVHPVYFQNNYVFLILKNISQHNLSTVLIMGFLKCGQSLFYVKGWLSCWHFSPSPPKNAFLWSETEEKN